MSEHGTPAPRVRAHPDRIREFVYQSKPSVADWNNIMTGEMVIRQGWGIDETMINIAANYKIIKRLEGDVRLGGDFYSGIDDVIFWDCNFGKFTYVKGNFQIFFVDTQIADTIINDVKQNSGVTFINCSGGGLNVSDAAMLHFKVVKSKFRLTHISVAKIGIVEYLESDCGEVTLSKCEGLNVVSVSSSFLPAMHVLSGSKVGLLTCDDFSYLSKIIGEEASIISFVIKSRTVIDRVALSKTVVEKMEVSDFVLLDNLNVRDESKIYRLWLGRQVLCDVLEVNDATVRHCLFGIEVVCRSLSMRDFETVKMLRAEPLSRVGNVHLRNGKVERMIVTGSQTSFSIANVDVQLFKLEKCEIGCFSWSAGNKGEYYIAESAVNLFEFRNSSIGKDALVNIADTAANCIDFTQSAINGQLVFRNLKAGEKVLFRPHEVSDGNLNQYNACGKHWGKSVVRLGVSYLKDLNADLAASFNTPDTFLGLNTSNNPTIILVNASMGKTEITGSNLDAFNIRYRNSRLLDLYVPGSEINLHEIQIDGPMLGEVEGSNRRQSVNPAASGFDIIQQKAFIHQQFKKVYDNQGDIVTSTYHHSQAMFYQSILLRKRISRTPFPDNIPIALELCGYWLNMRSNKHGESWPRALVFTIAAAVLFFTPYYAIVRRGGHFSFAYAGDYFKYLIQFIDLTHKYDFMVSDKKVLTAALVAFDFLGRLAVGYGIFQFISAFRRHGKKAV